MSFGHHRHFGWILRRVHRRCMSSGGVGLACADAAGCRSWQKNEKGVDIPKRPRIYSSHLADEASARGSGNWLSIRECLAKGMTSANNPIPCWKKRGGVLLLGESPSSLTVCFAAAVVRGVRSVYGTAVTCCTCGVLLVAAEVRRAVEWCWLQGGIAP